MESRWPEAPFYDFLMETQHVLRDDLGIVTEVQAGKPPSDLQYLGWNHSRAFLMQALSKGILPRAFENLKQRTPEAPLPGNDLVFRDDVEGDSTVVKCVKGDPDEVNSIEHCSVPRYALHARPFQEVSIA
ncbi:hypothetical protein PsorP6_003956 [Peronosclerospora sorghi]|uniref:Uncharacterized protein n=1 Tax=Peronosclerospora sorghi TaxID=230839 RepID=A0ACC0VP11_9STRA|nr:hypothetical protein PsorP6_003956 [Peronosclerospora sorghi]